MPSITPRDLETAAEALAKILGAAGVAGAGGWRWWQFWRRISSPHKLIRMVYLELVFNLLLCRHAQRSHPPVLLLMNEEWRRPTTPAALAEVLDEKEIIRVTAPYLQLAAYRSLFTRQWIELLPDRISGTDVAAMRTMGDLFADAESVLRNKLYSGRHHEELTRALEAELGRAPTLPKVTPLNRVRNLSGSVPLSVKLVALAASIAMLLRSIRRTNGPTTGGSDTE